MVVSGWVVLEALAAFMEVKTDSVCSRVAGLY